MPCHIRAVRGGAEIIIWRTDDLNANSVQDGTYLYTQDRRHVLEFATGKETQRRRLTGRDETVVCTV